MKLALFNRKSATDTTITNQASLNALAILLVLAQAPHLLHLPIWVSGFSAAIIFMRLRMNKHPVAWMHWLLSPAMLTTFALLSAFLVRLHYGYFLGRDPCVAFLSLLVAAKFGEVRRPTDATVLMCLAGFLLLTQYFYSQSMLSALVTLPAVLALGNALAVLRDPQQQRNWQQHIYLTGKMLLQGAPLAALLFVVFPRLSGPLWSLPDDAMGKTGLSDSMTPGTISDLSMSDEVAFRVEFDGDVPPIFERYWRGPVLTVFNGRRWSVNPQQYKVNIDELATSTDDAIDYTVTLEPHRQRWLFGLDQIVSAPRSHAGPAGSGKAAEVLANLTLDGHLIANENVKKVLRYRQRSILNDSLRPPREPARINLQLSGRNPKTYQLARTIRQQSTSDANYANRVLQRFTQNNYRYTLQPKLLGDAPVDEFLFDTLEGFCEHYSSAFVIMMRAAGIPARVVTGYPSAHAWAEAFINGVWLRFDPTGAVAPERVERGLAAAVGSEEPVPSLAREGGGWMRSLRLNIDKMNYNWQRWVVDFDNDSQFKLLERFGWPKPALWQLMLAVLVLAAVWCALLLGLPQRQRGLSPTERRWQHYVNSLAHLGTTRETQETPAQLTTRAVLTHRRHAAQIRLLGNALQQIGYEPMSETDKQEALRALNKPLLRLRITAWCSHWVRRLGLTNVPGRSAQSQ